MPDAMVVNNMVPNAPNQSDFADAQFDFMIFVSGRFGKLPLCHLPLRRRMRFSYSCGIKGRAINALGYRLCGMVVANGQERRVSWGCCVEPGSWSFLAGFTTERVTG